MKLSLFLKFYRSLMSLLLSCVVLTACSESLTGFAGPQHSISMANPASIRCVESGGSLSIQRDAVGNEYGLCSWPSGAQCEEWRYFRGECSAKKTDDLAK